MELGPVASPTVPATTVARRRRRRIALLMFLAAIVFGVFRGRSGDGGSAGSRDGEPMARPARVVPDSVRIKVEVINATSTRGLGRLATAWLRDKGFDVVGIGTAPATDRRDSTLVLDRSGHPEWARLAAQAMGAARVEARPDSLRYVDLTILVGRAWRTPPQTLYP